jgi:hypothetical protein
MVTNLHSVIVHHVAVAQEIAVQLVALQQAAIQAVLRLQKPVLIHMLMPK